MYCQSPRAGTAQADGTRYSLLPVQFLIFGYDLESIRFRCQTLRKAVRDRVQKADLQTARDAEPDHVALGETVIRINGQRFRLYAVTGNATRF